MAALERAIRGTITRLPLGPTQEERSNPQYYARLALLLIMLSILAGIALRLCGFVGGSYSWFLLSSAGDDSWMPMRLAYERVTGQSPGTLRELFFVDHVKFQYPATSLLLYRALDLIGVPPTVGYLNVLVWLSIPATAFLVFRICTGLIDKNRDRLCWSSSDRLMVASAFAVATLFFYPIMISWRLGQIQALLNLAFAAAALCWISERKLASGMLIGISCLIKPQFSLFLVWGLLRGQNRFALGQALAVGCGTLLSLALFGWENNIYYSDVLQYISHRGEVSWDNTSVNGLVNGLVYPEQVLTFEYHAFPHYNPVVYFATLLSSIVILAAAFLINRVSPSRGSVLDFMTAGLSFTFASPIAWGHHYGIALPILAAVLIVIAAQSQAHNRGNYLIGWGACLLLLSNYWNVSELLAGTSAAILQNWRLFAVVGLLWMLYRLQAAEVKSGGA